MSIAADASIVVASMWRMLLAWSGRSEMSERSQLCRDGSQASPLPGLGGLEPVCDPHTGL